MMVYKTPYNYRFFYLIIFLIILFFTFAIKLNVFFTIVIFLIFIYFVVCSILISHKYSDFAEPEPFPKKVPTVTVVTYAFNNFKPILETIDHIKKLEYPIPFDICVITDGTCDFLNKVKGVKQIKLPKEYFDKTKYLNVKAKIMNEGLKQIHTDNVLSIDGDTIPSPDVLMKLTGTLKDNVGIVVAGLDVNNSNNFIEKVQQIEYKFSFSLPKVVLSSLNSLDLGCGGCNLMSKKLFDEVGGYDEENITEDKEIAYKLISAGYLVKFVPSAKASTIVPSTFKSFFKQRLRWMRGGFDVSIKYLSLLFDKSKKTFGLFVLPYSFGTLILTISLVFKVIYNVLKYVFVSLYYFLVNLFTYGYSFSPIDFSRVIPKHFFIDSFFILLLISVIFSLYYIFLSFGHNDFKLTKGYLIPFIYFIFIHGFVIIIICIVSIIYSLFGVKYSW